VNFGPVRYIHLGKAERIIKLRALAEHPFFVLSERNVWIVVSATQEKSKTAL